MRTTSAIVGQCLPDVAISQYGDVRAVLALLVANNISVTDTLQPGQLLAAPPSELYNRQTAEYFVRFSPATAFGDEPDYNPGNHFGPVDNSINDYTATVVVTGQNVFDVTLQTHGDIRALIDVLVANNISITSIPAPGQALVNARSAYGDEDVVRLYKSQGHRPATADIVHQLEQQLFEIGLFEFGLFE